jgi:cytochrome c-type biogenesis protein CcmH
MKFNNRTQRVLPDTPARSRLWRVIALSLIILWLPLSLHAAEKALKFPDQEQEQRYHRLLEDLRCLKCANQSLAGSQAGLARDLRHQVYKQVVQGKSDKQVIQYLVDRYGDYVLYDPQLKPGTVLLFVLPIILLMLGLLFLFLTIWQKQKQSPNQLNNSDLERVDKLLAESDNEKTGGQS